MTDPSPPKSPSSRPPEPATDAEAARLLEAGLSESGVGRRTPPSPPEVVAPHFPDFEILEVLGQGGMGTVYKARQRKLDRLVALKVLQKTLAADPAFAERFAREGRTLARLQHPHIVGVHDFGEVDGFYYLVMEFVDGVTLRQLMSTGELSSREVLAIVPQICEALQYAHDAGVVHRDIKPENVLLDRAGRVKVADFGLAKMAHRSAGDFTLTGTDQVMGTLHYMAPEQYKTPQDVDHRADIFSLGVVFYEMLTGELPVGRFANPSEAPDLDQRIDEIVLRALERERDMRYQRAGDVESAVRTLVKQSAGQSRPRSCRRPAGQAAGRETPQHVRHAGLRLSAWARWAFLAIPLGGIAAVLVYALVSSFASFGYASYHAAIAGYWTAFGAATLVILLSIIGIVMTRHTDAVRGRGLSIVCLVLGCIGMSISLSVLGAEVRSHLRRLDRESERARKAFSASPHIGVVGLADPVRQRDLLWEVTKTWANYVRLVSVRDITLEDAASTGLYDAEDIKMLQALDKQTFTARREAKELGMGLLLIAASRVPPQEFQIESIQVDANERNATVRVTNRQVASRNGPMVASTATISFFMKRSTTGWVFAVDKVRIEEGI